MEVDFGILDPANAVLTLRGDLRFTPTEFDGQSCYLIEDPLRGKFFCIGGDEFTLISLLDGKNTVAQATGRAAVLLHERAFTENEAVAVCHWLLESQLAVCGGSAQGDRLAQSARKQHVSRLASYLNPLIIRLPLWNPNAALRRIAPYTQWLFSWPTLIVWCLVCLMGGIIAIGHAGELVQSSSVLLDRDNWLRLALVWLVLKILHETAHALACLHFGGTVPAVAVL
jgi:putative peptide zinc metalloprotease protein